MQKAGEKKFPNVISGKHFLKLNYGFNQKRKKRVASDIMQHILTIQCGAIMRDWENSKEKADFQHARWHRRVDFSHEWRRITELDISKCKSTNVLKQQSGNNRSCIKHFWLSPHLLINFSSNLPERPAQLLITFRCMSGFTVCLLRFIAQFGQLNRRFIMQFSLLNTSEVESSQSETFII